MPSKDPLPPKESALFRKILVIFSNLIHLFLDVHGEMRFFQWIDYGYILVNWHFSPWATRVKSRTIRMQKISNWNFKCLSLWWQWMDVMLKCSIQLSSSEAPRHKIEIRLESFGLAFGCACVVSCIECINGKLHIRISVLPELAEVIFICDDTAIPRH